MLHAFFCLSAVVPGDLVGVGRTLSRRDPLVVVYPADRFTPTTGEDDLLRDQDVDELLDTIFDLP